MDTLIICPYCKEEIKPHDTANLEIGDIIDCPICAAELEITELEPNIKVEYIESEK